MPELERRVLNALPPLPGVLPRGLMLCGYEVNWFWVRVFSVLFIGCWMPLLNVLCMCM
jgi:hypothetical protein